MQYFPYVHIQNYIPCLVIFSTFSDVFLKIFKHLVLKSGLRGKLVGSLKSIVKITQILGISNLSVDFTSMGKKEKD